MDVLFTDLDGTLLDRDTYSWEAARPALDRLIQKGIPPTGTQNLGGAVVTAGASAD